MVVWYLLWCDSLLRLLFIVVCCFGYCLVVMCVCLGYLMVGLSVRVGILVVSCHLDVR